MNEIILDEWILDEWIYIYIYLKMIFRLDGMGW